MLNECFLWMSVSSQPVILMQCAVEIMEVKSMQRRFIRQHSWKRRRKTVGGRKMKWTMRPGTATGTKCLSLLFSPGWRKNGQNNKWFFAFPNCVTSTVSACRTICYRFFFSVSSSAAHEVREKKKTNKYCRDIHIQFDTFGMRTIEMDLFMRKVTERWARREQMSRRKKHSTRRRRLREWTIETDRQRKSGG